MRFLNDGGNGPVRLLLERSLEADYHQNVKIVKIIELKEIKREEVMRNKNAYRVNKLLISSNASGIPLVKWLLANDLKVKTSKQN